MGPGEARNVGVKSCGSQYIALLDSDEIWNTRKIEIVKMEIEKTGADFFAHKRGFKLNCNSFSEPLAYKTNLISRFRLLFGNVIPTSSIVAKRELIINSFEESGRHSEDFYAIFRMVSKSGYIHMIDEYLVNAEKPPYGESGQGSNILKMKLAAQRVLVKLKREKLLNVIEYLLAASVSILKLPVSLIRLIVFKFS